MPSSLECHALIIAGLLSDCSTRPAGVAKLIHFAGAIDPSLRFRHPHQLSTFVLLINHINLYARDVLVSASPISRFPSIVWLQVVDYTAGIASSYPLISIQQTAATARFGRQTMDSRSTISAIPVLTAPKGGGPVTV